MDFEYEQYLMERNNLRSTTDALLEYGVSLGDIDRYLKKIIYLGNGKARNIRIMLVGHKGSGKTCLCKNLCEENFPDEGPGSTDGIDIYIQRFAVNMKTQTRTKLQDGSEYNTCLDKLKNIYHNSNTNARISVGCEGGTVNDLLTKDYRDVHRIITATPNQDGTHQEKCYASFWDFGGEEDFYNTHHVFLSSDAIYLLVFNLNSILTSSEEIERILFWLRSIATYSSDGITHRNTPPILLVGTHKDLLEADDAKEITQYLLQQLSENPIARKVLADHVQGVFALSNKNRNDDVFNDIWDKIMSISKFQSQWGKDIPSWWLETERILMNRKSDGVKVQTFQDVLEIYRTPNIANSATDDLKMFLSYMHLTGNCIFCNYGHAEMSFIIIDPQWLVKAFRRLITAPKFKDSVGRLGTLWSCYGNRGELTTELIQLAWSKDGEEHYCRYSHVLLNAMEHFGLLAKPMVDNSSLDEQTNTEMENCRYIVPCKLPPIDPMPVKRLLQSQKVMKTSTLCFRFKDNFVPYSIFDKVIATSIQRFEPFVYRSSDILKYLQRGLVCLRLNARWNVIICCNYNVMKVTLFKFTRSYEIEQGAGYYIRCSFQDLLQNVLEITHQTHLKFDTCIHCNFIVNSSDRLTKATDVMELGSKDVLPCLCFDETHDDLRREDYDLWFSKPEKTRNVKRRKTCTNTTNQDELDRNLTEKEMCHVSGQIGNAYYTLFTELGLTMTEIEHIRNDENLQNIPTKIFKMLHSWTCKMGSKATIEALSQALSNHGLNMKLQVTNNDEEIDHAINVSLLETPPTSVQLAMIAKEVTDNYYMFFVELGLTLVEIQHIQMSNRCEDMTEKFRKMLQAWSNKYGANASVGDVIRAMKKYGMNYKTIIQHKEFQI